GGLAQPAGVVGEGRVVEPAGDGAAYVEGLGGLAGLLDGGEEALVPDDVERQRAGRWGGGVGDADDDVDLGSAEGREPGAGPRREVAGEGGVRRCVAQRRTEMAADLLVGEVVVEQDVAGLPQPLQMEVQATDA